jgi:transcriptional regulator with XRE-family HTH domain
MSPKEVKRAVAKDLKERHITQQTVGLMMGMARQTIAGILSSDSYFTEKQASLFSMALGYNKEFLRTGNGPLLGEDSLQLINKKVDAQDRILAVYLRILSFIQFISTYVCMKPEEIEKNKKLLVTLRDLATFSGSLSIFVKEPAGSSKWDLLDGVISLMNGYFADTAKVLEQECGTHAYSNLEKL